VFYALLAVISPPVDVRLFTTSDTVDRKIHYLLTGVPIVIALAAAAIRRIFVRRKSAEKIAARRIRG